MITLYKFCNQNFNPILGCNTLKIGTLNYYRNIDPDFSISDPFEGISSGSTLGSQVTFTPEEMRDPRMQGSLFQISPEANVTFTIGQGVSIQITNLFIFSTSLTSQNNSLMEYNSIYKIKNHIFFAKKIAELLLKDICNLTIEGHSLHQYYQNSIDIQMIHGPVIYQKQPIEINERNKLDSFQIINDPIQNIFSKNEKYSADEEYRFVFIPSLFGVSLDVNEDFQIVTIDGLFKSICLSKMS